MNDLLSVVAKIAAMDAAQAARDALTGPARHGVALDQVQDAERTAGEAAIAYCRTLAKPGAEGLNGGGCGDLAELVREDLYDTASDAFNDAYDGAPDGGGVRSALRHVVDCVLAELPTGRTLAPARLSEGEREALEQCERIGAGRPIDDVDENDVLLVCTAIRRLAAPPAGDDAMAEEVWQRTKPLLEEHTKDWPTTPPAPSPVGDTQQTGAVACRTYCPETQRWGPWIIASEPWPESENAYMFERGYRIEYAYTSPGARVDEARPVVAVQMITKALGIPSGDACLIVAVEQANHDGPMINGRWLAHLGAAADAITAALNAGETK